MILAKAPLRISFFGGSSDIPEFYLKHIGYTISMAIDKHVYVTVMYTPYKHIKLSYSQQEIVTDVNDIKNELIRETLKYFNIKSNIEITTFADIPTIGTGLGGSSAFVCALIRAIAKYLNFTFSDYDVAELACYIEIQQCKRNIGKQDQYASVFGGMNFIQYGVREKESSYIQNRCIVQKINSSYIAPFCLLIPTLLPRQEAHTIINTIDFTNKDVINTISKLSIIALEHKDILPDINCYSNLLKTSWSLKTKISSSISNKQIDEIYDLCMIEPETTACKLLGAGGGGYMLALTTNKNRLKKIFNDRQCLDIKIEEKGARVVYYD